MANRMRSDTKEQYWRGQVSGWQSSGLGIRAYCQQQQLSEANFHAWRRELARRDQLAPPASATATPSVNDTSVTKPQTVRYNSDRKARPEQGATKAHSQPIMIAKLNYKP